MKRKVKHQTNTYAFNKTSVPYPEKKKEKEKPQRDIDGTDNSKLFKPKADLSLEEQAQQYMDAYRKAERAVINNFYTGGGAYRKGVMDAIYRGRNPLNP